MRPTSPLPSGPRRGRRLVGGALAGDTPRVTCLPELADRCRVRVLRDCDAPNRYRPDLTMPSGPQRTLPDDPGEPLGGHLGAGRRVSLAQRQVRRTVFSTRGLAGISTNTPRRRRWDSNPRWPCDHNGFRDRPIRPLSHSSSRTFVFGDPPCPRFLTSSATAGPWHTNRQWYRDDARAPTWFGPLAAAGFAAERTLRSFAAGATAGNVDETRSTLGQLLDQSRHGVRHRLPEAAPNALPTAGDDHRTGERGKGTP